MSLTPHTIAGFFIVFGIPLTILWTTVRTIRHAWKGPHVSLRLRSLISKNIRR